MTFKRISRMPVRRYIITVIAMIFIFIVIKQFHDRLLLTRVPRIQEPSWPRPFRTPGWIWARRLWDRPPAERLAKTCGRPARRAGQSRLPGWDRPWVRTWARRRVGQMRTAGSTDDGPRCRWETGPDRWHRPLRWMIRRPPVCVHENANRKSLWTRTPCFMI